MKACKSCENGRVTQALIGLANNKKTTTDKLLIVYCLEEREYKDKFKSCEKYQISN